MLKESQTYWSEIHARIYIVPHLYNQDFISWSWAARWLTYQEKQKIRSYLIYLFRKDLLEVIQVLFGYLIIVEICKQNKKNHPTKKIWSNISSMSNASEDNQLSSQIETEEQTTITSTTTTTAATTATEPLKIDKYAVQVHSFPFSF